MQAKATPRFDPKIFLAKADGGRTIAKYRVNQIVFSQGDPADSVFYIQEGKVKVTVVSEEGKEAVSSGWMNSVAKAAWRASGCAFRQRRP